MTETQAFRFEHFTLDHHGIRTLTSTIFVAIEQTPAETVPDSSAAKQIRTFAPHSICAPFPVRTLRPPPLLDSASTMPTRYARFCPSRPSFQTTSTSPYPRTGRQFSKPCLSAFAPDARSKLTFSEIGFFLTRLDGSAKGAHRNADGETRWKTTGEQFQEPRRMLRNSGD